MYETSTINENSISSTLPWIAVGFYFPHKYLADDLAQPKQPILLLHFTVEVNL